MIEWLYTVLKNRIRPSRTYLVQVFVRNHNLPIKVIFLPGMSLRDVFCSSRPYDRRKCTSNSCNICSRLEEGRDCSTMCPIYEITCNLYVGESSRSLNERLSEHLRFATNPTTESYKEEAMAVHYSKEHPGISPVLSFRLLGKESNTVLRKVYGALFIFSQEPELNDKEECKELDRFLVKGSV